MFEFVVFFQISNAGESGPKWTFFFHPFLDKNTYVAVFFVILQLFELKAKFKAKSAPKYIDVGNQIC